MVLLVKRAGHVEKFDERKIYASCYAACLNCHHEKKKAEQMCEMVMKKVATWVNGKRRVTSGDIFKQVVAILKKYLVKIAQ